MSELEFMEKPQIIQPVEAMNLEIIDKKVSQIIPAKAILLLKHEDQILLNELFNIGFISGLLPSTILCITDYTRRVKELVEERLIMPTDQGIDMIKPHIEGASTVGKMMEMRATLSFLAISSPPFNYMIPFFIMEPIAEKLLGKKCMVILASFKEVSENESLLIELLYYAWKLAESLLSAPTASTLNAKHHSLIFTSPVYPTRISRTPPFT